MDKLACMLVALASVASAASVEVDPFRGAPVIERVDLELGDGASAYALQRSFVEQRWVWSCDSRLVPGEGTARVWVAEDGVAHVFDAEGDGWVARYGAPWRLTLVGGEYALEAEGTRYRFDGEGRLVARTREGVTLRFVPGLHGTEQVSGPWGELRLERGPEGVRRASLGSAAATYGYQAGELVAVQTETRAEAYRYAEGRLSGVGPTTLGYDAAGRVTSLRGGRAPWSATYAVEGARWTCAVEDGAERARYTLSDERVEVEARGVTTVLQLDARLRPRMEEREGELLSAWSYDARGRLVQRQDPEGDVRLIYGEGHQPSRVILPSGEVLRFVYDSEGRVLVRESALGRERFAYDAQGALVAEQDVRGRTTRYKRDPRGYVVGVKQGAEITTIARSASGAVLAIEHPGGRLERFVDQGQALKIVGPDGATRRAGAFDDAGRLVAYQDEFGRATRLSYDDLGRVARAWDKDGERFRCGYDASGRMTELVDAAGNVVRYARPDAHTLIVEDPSAGRRELSFDGLGRLVREVRGDEAIAYRHDAAGRVIARTTSRGEERFVYDRAGRLLSQAGPDGELRYRYDAAGRLLSLENRSALRRIDYTYEDGALEPCEVRYPWGSVRYGYDDQGRLASVADAERSLTIERDARGRRVAVRYSTGVETRYAYAGEALAELATYRGAELLVRRAYTYDARGRVASVTDEAERVTRFEHDRRGRLVLEEGPERSVRYTYDAAGNRASVEVQGQRADLELAAGNRTLAQGDVRCRYDARGALVERSSAEGTWRFEVDVDGHLRRARGPLEQDLRYGYAPDGTLLWREVAGERQRLLVDRDQVVGEFSASGLQRSYVRGEGLDDVLWSVDGRGERGWVFHRDRVSSVVALSGAEGELLARYRYGAFGEALAAEGPAAAQNPWRYAGRPLDRHTGLYQVRARTYDATLGRFTSPDPSGRTNGLNLYAYAENDPTRFNDPLGLWTAAFGQRVAQLGEGLVQAVDEGWSEVEEHALRTSYPEYLKAKAVRGAGRAVGDTVSGIVDLFKKETWQDLYTLVTALDDWETVKAVGSHVWNAARTAGIDYKDAFFNDPAKFAEMTGYGAVMIVGSVLGAKGVPALARVARAASAARGVHATVKATGTAAEFVDEVAAMAAAADEAAAMAGAAGAEVAGGMAAPARNGVVQALTPEAPRGPARTVAEEIRDTVRERLDAPIPDEVARALGSRGQAAQQRAQALRERGVELEGPTVDHQRMLQSGTVQGRAGANGGRAMANFHEADELVKEWAEAGEELTLDKVRELNRTLRAGEATEGAGPGVVRRAGDDVFAGAINKPYVLGESVEEALEDFFAWYRAAEQAGTPPIELAAGAYQRLVSVHPFSDGNGRTARMVMDYVLRKNGLPPAALDESAVAVFGLGSAEASVTPAQALERVTQGVENSLDQLEQFGR
ncbi:MAG: RHS repeat-associated core domain-containing protein [Planctomycetota bacterium]